jgi:hypothetical protein
MRNHLKPLGLATVGLFSGFLLAAQAQAFEYAEPDADSYIVTVGEPADPKYANAGDNLRNGVGSIFIEFVGTSPGGFICTASAISPTQILTAAHCVRETDDTVSQILFVLSAGLDQPLILPAIGFSVHPLYDLTNPWFGAFAHGDIAVIELAEPLPQEIETYEIYRDFDEFGQESRHYGHGRSGKGNKGATGSTDFFYARTGLNTYEQTLEPLFPRFGIEDQLLYDFDSGGRKHNAMEWWFTSKFACHPDNPDNPGWAQDGQCTTFKDGSYPDFKGYGKMEVGIAPGDSGGPSFIDGKIAGVHSFGVTHFCAGVTNGTDFTCGLDSSYGEISGDTRVSFYQGFIDDMLNGEIEPTPVPEPLTEPPTDDVAEALDLLSPQGLRFLNETFSAQMRAKVE